MQHNTCKEILRYEKLTVKSGIFHGERQYIVEFILNLSAMDFAYQNNTGFLILKYIKKETNNYQEIVKKLGRYLDDNKN